MGCSDFREKFYSKETIEKIIHETTEYGIISDFRSAITTTKGNHREILESCIKQWASANSEPYFQGFIADVSDNVAKESRFQSLWNNANDICYTHTVDSVSPVFTSVNRKAIETFGYSEVEFVGMRVEKVFARTEEWEKAKQKIDDKLRNPTGAGTRYEVVVTTRNKGELILEISSVIVDEFGRTVTDAELGIEVLGIARDVTERERQKKELIESVTRLEFTNQQLEDARKRLIETQDLLVKQSKEGALLYFGYVVAHDLKKPLSNIRYYSETLINSVQNAKFKDISSDALSLVESINKESVAARVNLEDFLEMSRSGRFSPKSTNINQFLGEIRRWLNVELLQSQVEWRSGFCEDGVHAMLDPVFTWSSFANIIKNSISALKATDGERWISVKTSKQDSSVLIEFYDSGPGFDKDILSHLLNSNLPLPSHERGSGFGLSCAKDIVRMHGGRMTFANEGNLGAVVRIWLPRVSETNF